jgi:hypothetical protein
MISNRLQEGKVNFFECMLVADEKLSILRIVEMEDAAWRIICL